MTVTYTAEVATSSLGCFLKLLVRWKGSIYKLLWKDFLIFLAAYYGLSFTYRFALNETQRNVFENVAMYCDSFNNLIPVAFVLGFYVSIVLTRWWDQFNSIPWPDRSALFVTALIHGHDERGRLMRRTIMRYLCLSFTLTLSSISSAVKKRFPTLDHITDAGIMMPNEQGILEAIKTPHSKYFIPLVWATSLVSRARKEGRINDDFAVKTMIDEINSFRGSLGSLFNYDWISVPLVYTQVVTLAVYTFFLSCLMGRQFLQPKDAPQHRSGDFYVPVFTLLQFLFYMGWLKVAETLVNPFGEDDDDFEINWVIDRNLQVSYLVVDEMHSDFPELIRDAYWDEIDFRLPYTLAAESSRMSPHLGSAVDINVEPKMAEFIPLESIQEDDHLDEYYQQNEAEEIAMDVADRATSPGKPMKRLMSNDSTHGSGLNLIRSIQGMLKRSNSRASRKVKGSNASVALSSNVPSPRMPEDEIFQMSDISNDDEQDADSRTLRMRSSRRRHHYRMEPRYGKSLSHGSVRSSMRTRDSEKIVRRQDSFCSSSTLEPETPTTEKPPPSEPVESGAGSSPIVATTVTEKDIDPCRPSLEKEHFTLDIDPIMGEATPSVSVSSPAILPAVSVTQVGGTKTTPVGTSPKTTPASTSPKITPAEAEEKV